MQTDIQAAIQTQAPAQADFATEIESLVRTERSRRDLSLLDHEMLGVYRANAKAGLWTANLTKGLLYWSEEVYAIYGFPPSDGPIDFAAAMRCYPDEASNVLYDLIDQATQKACGFRFVLPLMPVGAGQRITIKAIAAYRSYDDGQAEIYGVVAPIEAAALELSLRA
jgi:hypothetical protein